MSKHILLIALILTQGALGMQPSERTDESSVDPNSIDDPQVSRLREDARRGDTGAQFLLGFLYANGQGLKQDYRNAVRWYTQAAERGHIEAQISLGMMFSEGQGVDRDIRQAIRWYEMAAARGNCDVLMILAEVFAGSGGQSGNLEESYKWMLLAEANGRNVNDLKKMLAGQLTHDQIVDAQQRAIAFLGTNPEAAKNAINQSIPEGTKIASEPISLITTKITIDPNQPFSERQVSGKESYVLQFPFTPKRTVVQDSARLKVVHYQALSTDGQVQYNASFQTFQNRTLKTDEEKKAFVDEYLAGRAIFAWENRIQKRFTQFQGQIAAMFKHTNFNGQTEMIHEGLVVVIGDNLISLSCVYPSPITPAPNFSEFVNSFGICRLTSKMNLQSTH